MLQAERLKLLTEYVQEKSVVTVQEICEHFLVSKPTVNRDLNTLAEKKIIVRVHGGALMTHTGTSFEPTQEVKEQDYIEQKRKIAQRAVALIEKGDTVLLDTGTTTLQLAKLLLPMADINVVTNDLKIAYLLCENPNINLIVVGGKRRANVYSLVGAMAEDTLSELNVDKFFMGVDAIDDLRGITNANIEESNTKKAMLKISKQIIVLADSSKFGKVSMKKICDCDKTDILITDDGVMEKYLNRFSKMGVKVYREQVTE